MSIVSDQRDYRSGVGDWSVSARPHITGSAHPLVQKAKHAGLTVAVWTVDGPAWVEHARSMGIEALITNDPAAMLCSSMTRPLAQLNRFFVSTEFSVYLSPGKTSCLAKSGNLGLLRCLRL